MKLCPFIPARQILFLLRREAVDLDAHGFEFQFGTELLHSRNATDCAGEFPKAAEQTEKGVGGPSAALRAGFRLRGTSLREVPLRSR